MADFDLTQTDAQVQSILDDAQNAQGAGAQTTLTTDYIMLKDTSGNYHKILKDSFTEACRNVLAGLLVNNDKGTTISQIPAIASGDFGSVTPANLASVLGVPSASFKATDDEDGSTIDNLGAGIYQFFSATYFSNAPRTGIVFCFIRGSYKFQVVLGFSGIDSHLILKSRYNNGSSWGIWGTLDFT